MASVLRQRHVLADPLAGVVWLSAAGGARSGSRWARLHSIPAARPAPSVSTGASDGSCRDGTCAGRRRGCRGSLEAALFGCRPPRTRRDYGLAVPRRSYGHGVEPPAGLGAGGTRRRAPATAAARGTSRGTGDRPTSGSPSNRSSRAWTTVAGLDLQRPRARPDLAGHRRRRARAFASGTSALGPTTCTCTAGTM